VTTIINFSADCSQNQKINFTYMYWNKTHCFGDEFIVHESLCHNTLVNFIHFTCEITKKWVLGRSSEELLNVFKIPGLGAPSNTVQLTAYTDKCWAFKRLSIQCWGFIGGRKSWADDQFYYPHLYGWSAIE
jgi:hypothetical protein